MCTPVGRVARSLPADLRAPAVARGVVRDALCLEHVDADARDSAVLLASELATDAVLRGRPPITLQVEWRWGDVWLSALSRRSSPRGSSSPGSSPGSSRPDWSHPDWSHPGSSRALSSRAASSRAAAGLEGRRALSRLLLSGLAAEWWVHETSAGQEVGCVLPTSPVLRAPADPFSDVFWRFDPRRTVGAERATG